MISRILMGLVLLLLAGACNKDGQHSFDQSSSITLQKTDCFGTCPVYTIKVEGNGQAKLVGEKFFDKIGTYRKQLTVEETEELFSVFVRADFWSFKDEYTEQVTDLPTTYLTFENMGRAKKVKDYYDPPQKLRDLEAMVEAIATSANWEKVSDKVGAAGDPYDQIRRGEYLVSVSGCHDCHSPKKFTDQGPVPDEARLLSGHPADVKIASYNANVLKDWVLFNQHSTAVVGPWGVTFAANITSDETGIGLWSEEQFIKCIREGKLKGMDNTRPLLPPMPWPAYAKMTDDDLKAIYAYLQFMPPVKNLVPPPIAPGPVTMK